MNKTLSRIYNGSDVWFDSYSDLTVIVGDAPQGPAMVPIFVKNSSDYSKVKNIFGLNSDLLNGFYEVCDNHTPICLIKLNGNHREINIHNILFLKSITTDKSENKTSINIYFDDNGGHLKFKTKLSEYIYDFENHNITSLCNKINADAIINACPFIANFSLGTRDMLCGDLEEYVIQQNTKYDFNNTIEDKEEKELTIIGSDGKPKIINSKVESFGQPVKSFEYTGLQADSLSKINIDDRLLEIFLWLEPYQIKNINLLSVPFDYRLTNKYLITDLKIKDEEKQIYEFGFKDLSDFNFNELSYFGSNDYPLDIYMQKMDNGIVAQVDLKQALLNTFDYYISQPGEYLYEYLSRYLYEKEKYLTPTFVNIGCTNYEGVRQDVDYFLENLPSLGKTPYINIVIDNYQTNIYDSVINNYYSNGVCLLSKAISNIQDYDNVTGYSSENFYKYRDDLNPLTESEKLNYNLLGIITTNVTKDGLQKISNGGNLLAGQDVVLNTIGNTNLLLHILKDIYREVTLEQTNAEIKKTINGILSSYKDVISKFSVFVTEDLQKNTINKTVTIELYIVGFLKKVKLSVEVV